jgi:hypothetical protein
MLVIMGLGLMRRPLELGMPVVVVGTIVGVRVSSGLVLRCRLARAVPVRMAVPVQMLVPMLMGVRVAVDQIAMPVQVVVHMLMRVGVLVVVLVFMRMRVAMTRLPGIVLRRIFRSMRVIVGETLAVGHGNS